MAFKENLDSICEMAVDVAQAAAQKTKQLAEIAKASLSIRSEEDKVRKAQLELGKLYYRDYVVGEEMDEAEYLPLLKQIDECMQTIADLQDYIAELKAQHVDMDADIADVTEEDFVETVEAEIVSVPGEE